MDPLGSGLSLTGYCVRMFAAANRRILPVARIGGRSVFVTGNRSPFAPARLGFPHRVRSGSSGQELAAGTGLLPDRRARRAGFGLPGFWLWIAWLLDSGLWLMLRINQYVRRIEARRPRAADRPRARGPRDEKKAQSQGLRLNPPKEEVLEETSDWHPTCPDYASARTPLQAPFCCYAKCDSSAQPLRARGTCGEER